MPIILVTGGASSGKSKFALSLVKKDSKVLFIATGVSSDSEMEERIKKHKSERSPMWETIEEPVNLVILLKEYINKINQPIIIDCLTFWISNLMFYKNFSKKKIINEANILSDLLLQYQNQVVVVTNELGMGLIPSDKNSRNFRMIAGEVNQIFSKKSKAVYLVVSGIPINIKAKADL